MKKVSVVILNWNGIADTRECLHSLKKNEYSNYNIILLDNNSGNDEANELEKEFGKYITVIRLNKNLGTPGGANVAIKYALDKFKSDYILYIDNDVIVDRRFLKRMVSVAESDTRIMLVGARTYFYDRPKEVQFLYRKINLLNNDFISLLILIREKIFGINGKDIESDVPFQVDSVGFWCLLIRQECIKKVGFFDEVFFYGLGEVDYSLRVKKAGYKSVVCPKAIIWHKYNSFKKINPELQYYLRRNRFLLLKKHAKNYEYYLYLLYFFGFHFWITLFYFMAFNKKSVKYYLKGILDGIKMA